MIKILCHYPSAVDASSYYRGIGVFSNLYRISPNIDHEMTSIVHWSVLKGADILFLQRPFLQEHIEALNIAKQCNVKTWIDYDDLLTCIPSYNPFLKIIKKEKNLSKEDIKKNVIKCLEIADQITVSTEFLKVKFSEFVDSSKIEVINNAHDDYFFPVNKISDFRCRNKIVFWRGSESHKNDLYLYENEIRELMRSNEDWNFVFMGYNPKVFMNEKNFKFIPGVNDIMKYFNFLKELRPAVSIVPLENHDFNLSKSNIAALESIYNGSIPVVPKFGKEWDSLGSIYSDEEYGLKETVQLLMKELNDEEIIRNKIPKLKMNLVQNYRLSTINRARARIAHHLMGYNFL